MQETSRFQESIHSTDCVADAVDFIWTSVNESITDKWLRTLELPIAIDMTMLKMNKIVAWSVASHDGALPAGNDYLERLIPEREPTPVSIDPWARGTVPMRKEIIFNDFNISSGSSVAPSVASRRSSRSSFVGRGARSFTSASGSRDEADETNVSGKIIELDEDLDFNETDSTASMFKLLQKTKRLKLRDTKGISGEKVNEFEAIKEDIFNSTKDLKGKKYVIDKEGKLVTVEPVRPETLPPMSVSLRACISENSFEDVPATAGAQKKKKNVRVAGSPAMNDLYFKAASTLATSLAGGDQIAVINPGVSIQSGDNMRSGETFPSDPRRANRKDYLRVGTGGSTYNIDDSYIESPSRSQVASPGATADSFFEAGEYESAPARAAFRVPDVDIFEGARKITEKEPEGAEEELGVALYGGMSSVSAGSSSSSRRPGKASDKQKRNISLLSGGPSTAGNRDRNIPLGMLPPSERTKLPAPPIGHTTGHGLMQVGSPSDKGLGGNNFSVSSVNSKYDPAGGRTNNGNMKPQIGSLRAGQ